ncbi:hypothetical protein ASZ90_011161 [hydrocarbon metagenome]|uniref:Uncharacterized protein n=1 Tax=hydrocarbon metagenome TaxID=938273 RepID=A0A0W8FE23_9ZZZZ
MLADCLIDVSSLCTRVLRTGYLHIPAGLKSHTYPCSSGLISPPAPDPARLPQGGTGIAGIMPPARAEIRQSEPASAHMDGAGREHDAG